MAKWSLPFQGCWPRIATFEESTIGLRSAAAEAVRAGEQDGAGLPLVAVDVGVDDLDEAGAEGVVVLPLFVSLLVSVLESLLASLFVSPPLLDFSAALAFLRASDG